jgi:hypothetical protein
MRVANAAPRSAARGARRYLQAFALGIPLVYAILLALGWNAVGTRDFDQFFVFHELQDWNYQLFGFAKQWTPLLCSGLSLAGEPQVPVLSLSMLLGYAFGPLVGLDLAIVLYLVWGWIGAYLYAGLCAAAPTQRWLAASLFIGNGFFVCRIGYGHMDFVPFLTLPFMLWLLHRVCEQPANELTQRWRLNALGVLTLAATLGVAVDGSPVAIIHLAFWIACYALVLSVTARSAMPLFAFLLAVASAALLDAGYLWPMIDEQFDFPRRTADTFTNPLALPWFALLPVRGKLIEPATGNGHELSVFIGPLIALALWRYRKQVLHALPRTLRTPLIIVSVVSVWMGMGSLRALHVPIAFSPFDWLRSLPGFRSMGVTGRYWGFLALPLSLLGAAALRRFAFALRDSRSLRGWMVLGLSLQFGFQIHVLADQAFTGHHRSRMDARSLFAAVGADIRYVTAGHELQGSLIGPRQGVVDCYDNDDFTRADMRTDSTLAQSDAPPSATAQFSDWNHIRISSAAPVLPAGHGARASIVLNQAYHKHWSSNECAITAGARGNMVATCDTAALARHPLELRFHDAVSTLGARVSLAAWPAWLGTMLALLAFSALPDTTRWSRPHLMPARYRARTCDPLAQTSTPPVADPD